MEKKELRHIAIVGNIGAGKTTLTKMLASHYNWTPQFEAVDNNPYLVDFYNDMPRWAFNLQIYFLNSRLKQLIDIQDCTSTVIQDRTIYEDAHIFALNLFEMGLMTGRDYDNYSAIFETIKQMVKPPDLMIYLKSSIPKLVDQIQKRGRDYEDNIRLDYLKKLNEHYNDWIAEYKESPLLIIEIDDINFADNPEDFAQIVAKIDAQINGVI